MAQNKFHRKTTVVEFVEVDGPFNEKGPDAPSKNSTAAIFSANMEALHIIISFLKKNSLKEGEREEKTSHLGVWTTYAFNDNRFRIDFSQRPQWPKRWVAGLKS